MFLKIFYTFLFISLHTYAQVAVAPKYDVGNYPSKNFIINPDSEKNDANVTDASSIHSRSTSSPLEGVASHLINSSAGSQVVKFVSSSFDSMLAGGNCEATLFYSETAGTAATYYTAYVENSSAVQLSATYTLENLTSGSKRVQMFFPCPSSDSVRVVIASSGNGADLKLDHIYTGACVDCISANPSASHLGTLSYAATTNCVWSSTNTSYTSFAADTDCPSQTVTGSLTAPATKIPGFVLTVKANQTYRITAKGNFNPDQGYGSFRFTDGTDSSLLAGGVFGVLGVSQGYTGGLTAIYTPTTSGSKTIQLQAKSAASDVSINTDVADLVFEVEEIALASQQAVRMDCVGTADCENVFSASVSSSGTVSAENVDWINGNCSNGSTGVFTCTFNTSLFSATPNCTVTVDNLDATNTQGISWQSRSASAVTYEIFVGGSDSNQAVSLICHRQLSDRKPQTNAPILVGGVTSSSSVVERIERAIITTTCSSNPCTITSSPAISSIGWSATGTYKINFQSGTFSSTPSCSMQFAGASAYGFSAPQSTSTSTYVDILAVTHAGALQDVSYATILCQGPR